MPYKDPEKAKAYKAAHYQQNAEIYKERAREHYYLNTETRKAWRKQYYADHAEHLKAASLAYYHEHADRILEAERQRMAKDPQLRARKSACSVQWQKDNPEAVAAREKRRRARKLDVFVEDVDPLVVLEMDDGVCGICGKDVNPFRFDVDHVIPLSRGGEHSYANSQVAHPRCNQSKGSKLPWLT